ncbi:ADP-ribose pyrophosphatase [Stackebrandtia albiflava]|uniref:ADP-ribose pyrophosphatase n=1 Tax=Stackebrandtia albiflava TaxID=406432 RepID=A0A562VET4_9ACTN|nr:NUDIX hydrolase [Stackebrandtia albiflava]TWJ16396.1 ADP-ribose pyrophosphatase [Stackebrandtia albiflava]
MSTHDFPVTASRTEYRGFRFAIDRDTVVMPDGSRADRIYMRHPGAVAVVAVDDDLRVALVYQYRHPVRQRLWEIPAGLRDVPGEDPAVTARRELAEEVDLTAQTMEPLIDVFPSPGAMDERIPVFLARGLSPVPVADRHVRSQEEADLTLRWWPLPEAVAGVMDGRIRNGVTAVAVLAAAQRLDIRHTL